MVRLKDEILKWKEPIEEIAETGPSLSTHYLTLQSFFNTVAAEKKTGSINQEAIEHLRTWFNGSMNTTDTLQGYTCLCPRGYYGDYTIIDKIYQKHHSTNPINFKWDAFFHTGNAAKAVRNRKAFFIDKLHQLESGAEVLNLASGTCRDLLEFAQQSDKKLKIDCLDMDINANQFAQNLLNSQTSLDVNFINENIFRYKPNKRYDLVWSAGLFDYFDDVIFEKLISRFIKYVKPKGNLIVGNFNKEIDSQHYMEFGGWVLNYRSPSDLLNIVKAVKCMKKEIEAEPLEANLFLNLHL